MTSHHHYCSMVASRRGPSKRISVLFPCSPSALLSFCLVLVYLFSLARGSYGVALGGGQGELIQPLPQGEENEEEQNKSAVLSSDVDVVGPANTISRVKRSRDSQQQLCGYRLLDALRNVCDRNFVGYTRRSDPSFMGSAIASDGGNDGQSGEDVFISSNNNMSPWDLALLTLEYPHSSPSSGAGDLVSPNNAANRDGNSILDYFELLPQQPVSLPPVVTSASSFPWASARSNIGGGGGGAAGKTSFSSKAFALKMLAEPTKTHQRFRRNIIDECCKKPCAMNQMLKYCAITAVGKRSY